MLLHAMRMEILFFCLATNAALPLLLFLTLLLCEQQQVDLD